MAGEPQRNPRYIAGLALGAIAILVVGYELRPRQRPSEVVQAPSQIESLRLQRLAERNTLDTMNEHFALVAGDQSSRIVSLQASARNGVFWSPDIVVTSSTPGRAPESTVVSSADGRSWPAVRLAAGPQLPLAAYRVEEGDPLPALPSDLDTELEPGQWVLAVWRQPGGSPTFVPGHYLFSRAATCGELAAREVVTSLDLIESMSGAGLFDLDGSLVALILPCDGRFAALTPDSVAQWWGLSSSLDSRLLATYGMRVKEIDESLRARFGEAEGAVVTEVWRGYPAAQAGLRPGDVIESLGGSPVRSSTDLQSLLAPSGGESQAVKLRRGRREITLSLSTAHAGGSSPAASEEAGAGILLEAPPAGVRVDSVLPGTIAATAGIRPGDRIVRVDFAAVSSAARVRRALERADTAPVFIELERGARRFGLWLE